MIEPLQALLKRGFMLADALFNRAFGERMNPLYHLGSIAFFLFWLVAVSGIYLYIFFDTSVTGAHASVESLTHEQWYAGGIMRSVHRYASDAMVVVMFTHLVRHFAFDRMRGIRWFSWITGIVLIWLLYTSGANGYMLPWDRLAQFVATGTFEWLSWLPGFGGTLVRNVIYPSSVNDRFFSLLVFIHIGVPLMLLLVMWVHVQRVPKAKMQPPRAIAASVCIALLALAIAVPVTSQGGPAELGTEPASLQLDWFYLSGYALLYRWSPGAVWALAGAATLSLAVLPWISPRVNRAQRQTFRLTLHPGAHELAVHAGETLLDAGLKAGLALPFECRNGGCGVCVCSVLRGSIDYGPYQPSVLTERMRASGKALLCCATARSDLEIEVESLEGAGHRAARTYAARIDALERLSEDVILLELSLLEDERIEFTAGQYLNVVLEDGQRRAFSFANAPHDNARIELHIRRVPGGRFTTRVFTELKVGDSLVLEGPFGRFILSESDKPILLVAGVTGFAPIKSIVEDAFHRRIERPMHLYWGARRRADLYMAELALEWQRTHANFSVTFVLSEETSPLLNARRGRVHEIMLADFPDLTGHEVYVCGSVRLIETAVPAFLAHGLSEDACVSDAFQLGASTTN